MTVRTYTSLDAGAPVLAGNNYTRLRQILMACLVTGFGSQPGAGWAVGHDVAGGFSLSNGDGVINWVSTDANNCAVYIMEGITDPSTALAGGVNRRSGVWFDGSSVTTRQYFYLAMLSSSNVHWYVVADEKTVILLVGAGTTTSDAVSAAAALPHYFGRYINTLGLTGVSEFCSIGGNLNPGSGNNFSSQSPCGSLLRHPFTGLVDQGASANYSPIGGTYGQGRSLGTLSRLVPSRLQPLRVALSAYGNGVSGSVSPGVWLIAGYLRGMFTEPTLCTSYLSGVCSLFGLSNIWQRRVQPISVPNGEGWMPFFPHNVDPGYFVGAAAVHWS